MNTASLRTRRPRRAVLALLLLALASTWLQAAWHQPMALAAAGNPALAAITCGAPLSAADVAQLIDQGLLPADSTDGHNSLSLCDLLTVPATGAVALPVLPADLARHVPAGILPVASPLVAAQLRLPPAQAPPVS